MAESAVTTWLWQESVADSISCHCWLDLDFLQRPSLANESHYSEAFLMAVRALAVCVHNMLYVLYSTLIILIVL